MGVPHMGGWVDQSAKDSASSASDAAVLDLETETGNRKNERFTRGVGVVGNGTNGKGLRKR